MVKQYLKKKKKSIFRKIVEWLHLWLGLASGIVVFIVCLTAAVWVFRPEIERFTLTHFRTQESEQRYLQPSHLRKLADAHLSAAGVTMKSTSRIFFGKKGWSASVNYQDADGGYATVYLNPHSGEVLYLETELPTTTRFMLFLRAGHRFFWLPPEVGSPLVGVSCIFFLITLITGLIWWYPNKWTKSTRQKSFKVKWNANWKRLNIDLHNVLGFYSAIVAIVLTITGIYYSFAWFKEGYHRLLTGKTEIGSTYPYEITPPISKSTSPDPALNQPEDIIWQKIAESAGMYEIDLILPADTTSPYTVYINPDVTKEGYYYRMYARYFDQYTLAEILPVGKRHIPFAQLSRAEKIFRANYEIHVGSIGGLPTRILASIISLIGASLPITGFIIWYNRKWGKMKKKGSIV